MKIAHVKISNILGIAELEFTPAGFNEISGPNGTGKTSVLEAIKAALSTGHDATLLRKGAERVKPSSFWTTAPSCRRPSPRTNPPARPASAAS